MVDDTLFQHRPKSSDTVYTSLSSTRTNTMMRLLLILALLAVALAVPRGATRSWYRSLEDYTGGDDDDAGSMSMGKMAMDAGLGKKGKKEKKVSSLKFFYA